MKQIIEVAICQEVKLQVGNILPDGSPIVGFSKHILVHIFFRG
jgi:hypothetical protein